MNLSQFPLELRTLNQGLCWRFEERNGKQTKVPYNAKTRDRASVVDPDTWTDVDTAIDAYSTDSYSGVGFVLDGFVGVDLDDCVDPKTKDISPAAKKIVQQLDSYTEHSPSKTGLHIYIRGQKPGGRCRSGLIEVYEKGRYFTVTGDHVPWTPRAVEKRQAELESFYESTFTFGPPSITLDDHPPLPVEPSVDLFGDEDPDSSIPLALLEHHVDSWKALGVEVELKTDFGTLTVVPEYTTQDRLEISAEHAAVLTAICAVFPGSRMTGFRKKTPPEPDI